jgi:4-hydroxy-2-oxoheptanedioate aldolase
MLKKNFLKEKLENNIPTIGTWNIIDSPMVVDVIASSGLDFIVIDAEHGAINYETAQLMVGLCENYGVSPIMRVGEINESLILRALDVGMHGIQLPNITTSKDARKFVQYAKYSPMGTRGFSPYTKAGLYDVNNAKIMPKLANDNTLLIANVEDEAGLKNLKSIAKTEGIDIIFIGLFDLSKSLGMPGDIQNKMVLDKLDEAVAIIHGCNKKVGSIASTPEMLAILKSKNLDYITYSVDTGMVKNAYQTIIEINPNNHISMCLDRLHLSNFAFEQRIEKAKKIAGDRLIIQSDGYPMSGGEDNFNTTLQAIATADVLNKKFNMRLRKRTNTLIYKKIVEVNQLISGGTNSLTAVLAKQTGVKFQGVSLGTFARKIVKEVISNDSFYTDQNLINKGYLIAKELVIANIGDGNE